MLKLFAVPFRNFLQWQKTDKILIFQVANGDMRCVWFALGKVPPFVLRHLNVVIFLHYKIIQFVDVQFCLRRRFEGDEPFF